MTTNLFEVLTDRLRDIEAEKMPAMSRAIGTAISDQAALKTPVDTSTLINSRYVVVTDYLGLIETKVGYSANYARAVHDMPGTLMGQPRADFGSTADGVAFGGGTGKGRYWDPNAEPKFLEIGKRMAIKEDLPGIIARFKQ